MTIAYTLVNIKYLPVAKTMVDSFVEHNPDISIYICLFDEKKDIQDSIFLEYNIYDKSNLNKEEYDSMRSRYDDMSMACALKPFFAEALIRDYNPDNIIYLDADMMFFSSIQHLSKLLLEPQNSIILTGHIYTIISSDAELILNQSIRKNGIFNAGFFALKNNNHGVMFLNWWKKILFVKCIKDVNNAVLYDQTWLDLIPLYFENNLLILKDLGYNVAFWNGEERKISKKETRYFINDNYKLVFYHFARYNYYNTQIPYKENMSFEEKQNLEDLFRMYKLKLKNNLFEKYIFINKKRYPSIFTKIKISLKYRLTLLVDKL